MTPHYTGFNNHDFGIALQPEETYINRTDITLKMGLSTLRHFRDFTFAMRRIMLEFLPEPLTGLPIGMTQSNGLIHQVAERLHQSPMTCRKAIEENLGAQFVTRKGEDGRVYVIRVF